MKRIAFLILALLLLSILSCATTTIPEVTYTPGSPESDKLGTVWHSKELGWDGVWTRRGNTNVFDAVWTKGPHTVTAVLTMEIRGSNLHISRRHGSDGVDFDYTGALVANDTKAIGSYSAAVVFGGRWEATITRTEKKEIVITSDPAGAGITVNDEFIGNSPVTWTFTKDPGKEQFFLIKAEKSGFRTDYKTLKVPVSQALDAIPGQIYFSLDPR
jgi:hypothetical protein